MIHPALEKYFLSLPSSDDENAFLFSSLAEQAQRNVSPLSKEFRKLMEQAHMSSAPSAIGTRRAAPFTRSASTVCP